MSLEQPVADSGTAETGVRFVETDDTRVAQFDVDELGADGPNAELEILRGDLARVLHDACGDGGRSSARSSTSNSRSAKRPQDIMG